MSLSILRTTRTLGKTGMALDYDDVPRGDSETISVAILCEERVREAKEHVGVVSHSIFRGQAMPRDSHLVDVLVLRWGRGPREVISARQGEINI